ncbi:MAG TPA: hypothetical protein VGN11_03715, partial [Candidatus Baltobacteraceae bacterium]|nr:hypothetical protein [Candidatus Baltobacteraceae bacterium]
IRAHADLFAVWGSILNTGNFCPESQKLATATADSKSPFIEVLRERQRLFGPCGLDAIMVGFE